MSSRDWLLKKNIGIGLIHHPKPPRVNSKFLLPDFIPSVSFQHNPTLTIKFSNSASPAYAVVNAWPRQF